MGMFGGEKKSVIHGAVDSVIGERAKFKGELVTPGAVSVNGGFEGKLSSEGEVIIGRGSKILGDVEGSHVVVSGKVNGNITALQSLEITKSGRVNGDLTGGRISIEEGSSYRGRVRVETGKSEIEEEIIIEDKLPIA
ncbi:MAG: polymer-forming cytoskeletal protein [Candidatus Margulisiibacteriota bacterium]|nr:polymer-forming cytoskeletal protein [Candidatus Margulisiibacteriota bacterium]